MDKAIKLSLRLLIITIVAGLLLGLTNNITKEPIEQQKLEALNASKYIVFPSAKSFETIHSVATSDTALVDYPAIKEVAKVLSGSEIIGYAFMLSTSGYKDKIDMTMGVSSEGAITGMTVTSQAETAGLGTKIAEEPFTSQYKGIAAEDKAIEKDVDTISGATISSSAVRKATVQAAQFAVTKLGLTPNEAKEATPEDLYRIQSMPLGKQFSQVNLITLLGDYSTIVSVNGAYVKDELVGYSFDLAPKGFGGPINFTIGMSTVDNVITGITIKEHSETEGYGDKMEEPEYLAKFVNIPLDSDIDTSIDAISGATVTTKALKKAVKQAIGFKDQYLTVNEPEPEPSTPVTPATPGPIEIPDAFKDSVTKAEVLDDGTYNYIIKAEGFHGDVITKVLVNPTGDIQKVSVIMHEETEGYGDKIAMPEFLNQFTGKKLNTSFETGLTDGTGIDAVAGATFSTNAVRDALLQAIKFHVATASSANAAPASGLPTAFVIPPEFNGIVTKAEVLADGIFNYIISIEGFHGPVNTKVLVKPTGIIDKVAVIMHEETEGYGDKIALPEFLDQFSGRKLDSSFEAGLTDGTGIDAVAGATYSTNAVRDALIQAIKFYATAEVPTAAVPETPIALTIPTNLKDNVNKAELLADGTYNFIVKAEGFHGDVVTKVLVTPTGNIQKVSVIMHEETEGYGDKVAMPEFLDQFTGKKVDAAFETALSDGTGIDAVTGATYSTMAVRDGLVAATKLYQQVKK